MAIGHAVVYYSRAAHAFSAGIRCRHCTLAQTLKTHYLASIPGSLLSLKMKRKMSIFTFQVKPGEKQVPGTRFHVKAFTFLSKLV